MVANTGLDIGTTILAKMFNWLAPSIFADLIMELEPLF